MSARDFVFLACLAAMVLSLFCAAAGVALWACLTYFVVALCAMTMACLD